MKVLTANLEGLPLDWAFASAETQNGVYHECGWDEADGVWVRHFAEERIQFEHTDPAVWSTCIAASTPKVWSLEAMIHKKSKEHIFRAIGFHNEPDKPFLMKTSVGRTPAEAVARCIVLMNLGSEVEIPDELISKPERPTPSSLDFSLVHNHD